MLAFFQNEKGGVTVKNILLEASQRKVNVYMSAINLGEIYYIAARRLGNEAAKALVKDVLRLPIHVVDPDMDRVLAAARLKAKFAIAYADTFVVALAQELKGTVITGDPEFSCVEEIVKILWIR